MDDSSENKLFVNLAFRIDIYSPPADRLFRQLLESFSFCDVLIIDGLFVYYLAKK
jgi:hypothetical protein